MNGYMSENIKQPIKEEIEEYYIQQLHSRKECAQHFGMSLASFERLLKQLKIYKSKDVIQQRRNNLYLSQNISKDALNQYYIAENHTVAETAQHFQCGTRKIEGLLHRFNLHKDSVLINQIKKQAGQRQKEKYLDNKLSFDELYNYYIVENHTYLDTMKYFQISDYILKRCLRLYNIHKDRKQININRIKNNIQKYGVENHVQSHIQHYELWQNIEELKNFLSSHNPKWTLEQIGCYFNVEKSTVHHYLQNNDLLSTVLLFPKRSIYEDEIINFLKMQRSDIIVQKNVKDLLPSGREIDIYLPEYHIGIEFNGDYWHSDQIEKFQDHHGRSVYHQEKSLEAQQNGIFLFHIFEHEWSEDFIHANTKLQLSKENIKARLQQLIFVAPIKIGARKCEVRELTYIEKSEFLKNNHVQGNDHTSCFYVGLFYNNTLISCMCFGKSKYKKYQWELTRFASKHNYNVQGGASKLFNYFVQNKMNNDETIVSYNDITKTRGDLYTILGFDCISVNSPNYWWVNLKTKEVRTRYQEQNAGEISRMHEKGFVRVCDCGTKTWIYKKQKRLE